MKEYTILRNTGETKGEFFTRVANEIRCMDCKIITFDISDFRADIVYQNFDR